jgi:hypothetical protein
MRKNIWFMTYALPLGIVAAAWVAGCDSPPANNATELGAPTGQMTQGSLISRDDAVSLANRRLKDGGYDSSKYKVKVESREGIWYVEYTVTDQSVGDTAARVTITVAPNGDTRVEPQ